MDSKFLSSLYQSAHNEMRNVDGLQPQEALDELLKYLFFKERDELNAEPISVVDGLEGSTKIAAVSRKIGTRFSSYISDLDDMPEPWISDGFKLSDLALIKVHALFQGVKISQLRLDLRSSALREFLTGPVRKGLGIFLTPEEVVREIVAILNPQIGDKILDPACGSGTFLTEAIHHIAQSNPELGATVFGMDKNPRMIQLAEFNCGHIQNVVFERAVADSLIHFNAENHPSWFQEKSFDIILTNPPFGVSIDKRAYPFDSYDSCKSNDGQLLKKQSGEIVFLERAMQLLKPGGKLGIVLPRSIITNKSYEEARSRIGKMGAVLALFTLPSETFSATGTQTTTVVLIIQKYSPSLTKECMINPIIARLQNVGFDSTGRLRDGSELVDLGLDIRDSISHGKAKGIAQLCNQIKAEDSFTLLENMLGHGRKEQKTSNPFMCEFVELATTGSTPARSAYADDGLFLVKVGNLSGKGINWQARDRNYVGGPTSNRFHKPERQLISGDILLTSSAHAPRYIGKKIDIITKIPKEVGAKASFVGEVMLLRPKSHIDPFRLLAYLRSPEVVEALQDRVKGQTAHLHPSDVLDMQVDIDLYNSDTLQAIAKLYKREADLNDELNQVSFDQLQLREELVE